MDLDEISNIHRGPAIDDSHQISVHLANSLREEFFNSANQKQESPVVAIFVNGSGQIEQSL
jgi:hypothetical protein